MELLKNKRALVIGVASTRSIAYGIAEALHSAGCELAFTYPNEKFKERVESAAQAFDSSIVLPCDVSSDEQINDLARDLQAQWQDGFDILIHAVAYAPAEELEGNYVEHLTRAGFQTALDVSCYSLGALAQAMKPQLRAGASILTLSYLGAERAVPNYNVMGVAKAALEANVRYLACSLGPDNIRVNAISAGPIRTLAASGIGGFRAILQYNEKVAPLRRNVTSEDVGKTALFLASDWASAITGEVLYVDAGFNIVAFPAP